MKRLGFLDIRATSYQFMEARSGIRCIKAIQTSHCMMFLSVFRFLAALARIELFPTYKKEAGNAQCAQLSTTFVYSYSSWKENYVDIQ